jgi:molybdopterin-guanine dinucleotide biosynthesis protein A
MHIKHAKLARTAVGSWSRHEWAILGTACGNIQRLAADIAAELGSDIKVGYADADHRAADAADAPVPLGSLEYVDKINFHRLDFRGTWNDWTARTHFSAQDIVLVNGNHFIANRQILALDQRKMESLSRKCARLSRVELLLTHRADPHFLTKANLPDFLKEHLPNWADIPVLDLQDTGAIAAFIRSKYRKPVIKGLILAGGHSTRMGQDKSTLQYHGEPQWRHLQHLFQTVGIEASYISCREDQVELFKGHETITDSFIGLGPFGAVLSAFRQDPDAAWLTVACDLPMLDESTLRYLMEHRRTSAIATCFRQPETFGGWEMPKGETGFPEPLTTIWEPKSYPVLLQFLAQGISCLRKVLHNMEVQLLDVPDPHALLNINTPEERKKISINLQH